MASNQDPRWEIVDELPNEKKPRSSSKRGLQAWLTSKALWVGILIGAGLVILIPALRLMLFNAIRAWWIWVGLALYFVWARMKKAEANRRR